MKWFLFFFFSSLLVFLTTVYFRLGGYKPVQIEISESQELYLLMKEHVGAYHKINSVITEVEQWAAKQRLPCTVTFGEYIDDPRVKDEDRLRSRGGCVLPFELSREILLPKDLLYVKKPKTSVVKAYFEGAPSISPFKVYPAVEDFMQEKGLLQTGPVIEIYKIYGEKQALTEYLFEYKAAAK